MGLAALLLVATTASLVLATPLRFDQRQNGSVNVQVDLKDLEVYAIMKDEQLEGAMVQVAQAADSVKPRPNAAAHAAAEAYETLKAAAHAGVAADTANVAPAAVPAAALASVLSAAAAANGAVSSNAPRRPNDKLGSIKHKTGGLLPHERSDVSPDMPPWESAAARGEEHEGLEEELEPRATTAVEARAAPAAASAVPAPPSVSPASRPAQSQGVRPAGTVSVAHLHCGMGYYRDQSGRCRRSRRPPSSNTRKHHHHHHGTRKHKPTGAAAQGSAAKTAAPSPVPAPAPAKDTIKDVAKHPVKEAVQVELSPKGSPKDTSKDSVTKDSKEPVKEATKEAAAAATPAASTEPSRKDSPPLPPAAPALPAVPGPAKAGVKEPAKAHPVKQAPVKEAVKTVAAKTPVTVQDRIASGSGAHKVVGVSSTKQAVKPHAAHAPAGPVREVVAKPVAVPVAVHHQQQLRQQQRQPVKATASAPAKDKEAPKVSHHHGQHKITVIKEDTKPRAPPAAPSKTITKAAAPVPPAPIPAKKN